MPLDSKIVSPNLLIKETIRNFTESLSKAIEADDLQKLLNIQTQAGDEDQTIVHDAQFVYNDTAYNALSYSLIHNSKCCFNALLKSLPSHHGMVVNDSLGHLVQHADIFVIKDLIEKKLLPLDKPISLDGRFALHWAVLSNKDPVLIVRHLLSAGVEINVKDYDGVTPALLAIQKGCHGVVRVLLNITENQSFECAVREYVMAEVEESWKVIEYASEELRNYKMIGK